MCSFCALRASSIYYHNLPPPPYSIWGCSCEGLKQGYIFKISIFTPMANLHILLTIYVSCHKDGAKSILMLWLSKQTICCLKLVLLKEVPPDTSREDFYRLTAYKIRLKLKSCKRNELGKVESWALTRRSIACFCFKKSYFSFALRAPQTKGYFLPVMFFPFIWQHKTIITKAGLYHSKKNNSWPEMAHTLLHTNNGKHDFLIKTMLKLLAE